MACTQGLPGSKHLRVRFCKIESVAELEDIAAEYLSRGDFHGPEEMDEENAVLGAA